MQLRATRLTAIASAVKRAFNIRSLFAGGAPGVWYDPSDFSTLFQDSAGTTPVTAVEQPVGLMLDKSQGLVLGSDVFGGKGTFDDPSYWATDPGCSVSSGAGTFTAAGANNGIGKIGVLTAGKTYQVTYTISTIVAGSLRLYTNAQQGTARSTTGTFTELIVAGNANIFIVSTGAATATIDNFIARELPGNHAFQATSASRPVLSARYNLLTKTEALTDAAVWKKLTTGTAVAPVVTANYGIAPDGTQTATRIQLDRGDGVCIFYQEFQAAVSVSLSGIAYIKTNDGSTKTISFGDSAAGPDVITVTGTWQKFTSIKSVAQVGKYIEFATRATTSQVADILVWQPQSVPANQSTLPYQRVNTATDYNSTGFLPYLKFDGIDDSLSTNSISFTSTDKMSVFAGVRRLVDGAATQAMAELSSAVDTNAGTFLSYTQTLSRFGFASRGSASAVYAEATQTAAPFSLVYTGLGDISGDRSTLRVNGTQVAQSTADQGTGNYGNYPLYIGRRNNATFPFNGQMYSMIIVGKAVTAGELSSTEKFVASKTGVTL